MKKLLAILVLGLLLITPSQADDISEFEIEGMSIGDSLLDYVNLGTIKNSRQYTYKSDKFYTLDLILDKFTNYFAVQIHLKKDDKKYQIHGLGGAIKFGEAGIYYPESKKECKKLMHIIESDIDKIFSNAHKQTTGEFVGQGNYDPKAVRNEIYYTIETGESYLQCTTWGKKAKKKNTYLII